MSMFKDEFLKAARETPRMFFAPLVGAVEAVWRELDGTDKKKKKGKDKDGKAILIYPRTYRRFRAAAHKAREKAMRDKDRSV